MSIFYFCLCSLTAAEIAKKVAEETSHQIGAKLVQVQAEKYVQFLVIGALYGCTVNILAKYLHKVIISWNIFCFALYETVILGVAIPKSLYPAGIYVLKVNNRNFRTRCEIYSKLTIKTLERHHRRQFGVFIVNSEHILHLF